MEKLLFFDIETHRVKGWNELSPTLREAFRNHLYDSNLYTSPEECYNEKAGLHAEFSQVICVSLGYEWESEFKVISIHGINEIELLIKLSEIFDRFMKHEYFLAGHNIIGFDIPYLIKRYIINKIKVPKLLNSNGVKSWEKTEKDTMQLWKFGGWQNVSLEVISASLGMECKSTKISGKTMYLYDIKDINWEELKKYCESDMKTSYEIYKQIKEFLL